MDAEPNAPATGPGAEVPAEVRGWNWAALLLHWIWALAHGFWVWAGLLCATNFLALWYPWVSLIWLGGTLFLAAKGTEIVWRKGTFRTPAELLAAQR